MEKIILASGSPRRKELLMQGGIPFEVIVSQAEEVITQTIPSDIVKELSCIKAQAVAEKHPDRIVLGADTVVVLDGRVLGKPADEADAAQMLCSLQGRSHEVYTGVTLVKGKQVRSFFERTEVFVYPMTEEEIQTYVDSKDPLDKAGAYGIQGAFAIHIQKINGDYYNVVGLPIGRLWQELKDFSR